MFERVLDALFGLILLVASVLAMLYGITTMRVVTEGVGLIAIAIWLAVLLRILQAKVHHHEIMAKLDHARPAAENHVPVATA